MIRTFKPALGRPISAGYLNFINTNISRVLTVIWAVFSVAGASFATWKLGADYTQEIFYLIWVTSIGLIVAAHQIFQGFKLNDTYRYVDNVDYRIFDGLRNDQEAAEFLAKVASMDRPLTVCEYEALCTYRENLAAWNALSPAEQQSTLRMQQRVYIFAVCYPFIMLGVVFLIKNFA